MIWPQLNAVSLPIELLFSDSLYCFSYSFTRNLDKVNSSASELHLGLYQSSITTMCSMLYVVSLNNTSMLTYVLCSPNALKSPLLSQKLHSNISIHGFCASL